MTAIWVKNKKEQHEGKLSVQDDNLDFFDGEDSRIFTCERVRVKFINRDGIMFTGFEQVGVDRNGNAKYRYVEPYFLIT